MPAQWRCLLTIIDRVSAAAIFLALASPLSGETVVVPDLVVRAEGVGGALWGSELRFTNTTGSSQTVEISDWIGTPGWRPSQVSIPPHSAVSLGGWNAFNSGDFVEDRPGPIFGAAVLEVSAGIVVQSAVLAGSMIEPPPPSGGPGGPNFCSASQGGYAYKFPNTGNCNRGSGPVMDSVARFLLPGEEVDLLWLDTTIERRVNLYFVNAGTSPSSIDLTIVSADGSTARSSTYSVAGRNAIQLNDIFVQDAWKPIRDVNYRTQASAARGHVRSSQPYYVVAYLISNLNQTVGVSLPRVLP